MFIYYCCGSFLFTDLLCRMSLLVLSCLISHSLSTAFSLLLVSRVLSLTLLSCSLAHTLCSLVFWLASLVLFSHALPGSPSALLFCFWMHHLNPTASFGSHQVSIVFSCGGLSLHQVEQNHVHFCLYCRSHICTHTCYIVY